MLQECGGRIWEGKEAILEALAALTAGAPPRFEPEEMSVSGREELAQSNLGVTVLSSVLYAVQRKNQVYQTAAMKVSSPSSTVGSKISLCQDCKKTARNLLTNA